MSEIYIGAINLSAYPFAIIKNSAILRLRFDSLPAEIVEELRHCYYPRQNIYAYSEHRFEMAFPAMLSDSIEHGSYLILSFSQYASHASLVLLIRMIRSAEND